LPSQRATGRGAGLSRWWLSQLPLASFPLQLRPCRRPEGRARRPWLAPPSECEQHADQKWRPGHEGVDGHRKPPPGLGEIPRRPPDRTDRPDPPPARHPGGRHRRGEGPGRHRRRPRGVRPGPTRRRLRHHTIVPRRSPCLCPPRAPGHAGAGAYAAPLFGRRGTPWAS
jgi:hypothetical protein